MVNIILITFETNPEKINKNGSLYYWLKSVSKQDWTYFVIGTDQNWRGFGQKIRTLKEFLKNRILKEYGYNTIIIFTDARDVILNNKSPKKFQKRFR